MRESLPFVPAPPRGFAPLPASGPLVSVLIRTRDRPVLLARALASVAAQRAPAREVVVVNDGGDAAAVEAVVARHRAAAPEGAPPLRLLHQAAPLGCQGAAEAARAAASGPLLALLDDDDSWEPEFLAAAEARLRAPEDGIHLAGTVSHWRRIEERIAPDGTITKVQERIEAPAGQRHVGLQDVMRGRNPLPSATVLRAEAVARAGGWDSHYVVGGDWIFNLRLLALGDLAIIPRPLANWNRRPGIASGASPLANLTTDVEAYKAFRGELHTGLLRAALASAPWFAGPLLIADHTAAAQAAQIARLRGSVEALREALGEVGAALPARLDAAERALGARLAAIEARLAALEATMDGRLVRPGGGSAGEGN